MWPFAKSGGPTLRRLDARVSVTGQIRPQDLPALHEAGFRTLICTRPDHEEAGQPSFAELAAAAGRLGLAAHHIPVTGGPTPAQVAQYRTLMAGISGPVLGWCRSGARAEALHRLARD